MQACRIHSMLPSTGMKLTFKLCTGEVCLMNFDAAMLRGAQVTLSMNRPGFRKRGWSLPVLFAACMVNQSVTDGALQLFPL